MEQFTIYCTPEQTHNALELGAPIEVTYEPSEHKEPILYCNNREYLCPTAEQMIGWLETQGVYPSAYYNSGEYLSDIEVGCKMTELRSNSNRRYAELSAIDAALEYLTNSKKL